MMICTTAYWRQHQTADDNQARVHSLQYKTFMFFIS